MTKKIEVELQIISVSDKIPEQEFIEASVTDVLGRFSDSIFAEVCVRIVDEEEGRSLTKHYFGSDKPTNVLAFPYPTDVPPLPNVRRPIGDIVICAPVVEREAVAQGKDLSAHWLHLLVHGTLHLLGYDHDESQAAEQMETLEKKILASHGIRDPYSDSYRG